ncbi:hypothetical protein MMU07_12685 [Aquiflexum sp. LQ15W]|uniref:hypothetical protein n=1 Tax=Cognataquiflexum nitidum TaxID=2922272 RepID=UPI001F148611|nr:hypothetical protein [Cognataquiflexum nitidum]MCH6200438.1 hypothetical protein [Cognataquiflexum nitidum]
MKKSGFNKGLFFALVIYISSCDGFVPDPIDPRLPVYSESGKNQAGALINNIPFKDHPRVTVFGSPSGGFILNQADTTLILQFSLSEKNKLNEIKSLHFCLEKLTPEDWRDMEKDFGKKFSFENPSIKGKIIIYSNDGEIETLAESGQITIKHIPASKAMAGTFGFTAEDPTGKRYEIRFGRFDYLFQRF